MTRMLKFGVLFGYSESGLQRLGGARGQLLYLDGCRQFLELDVPIVVFQNFVFLIGSPPLI